MFIRNASITLLFKKGRNPPPLGEWGVLWEGREVGHHHPPWGGVGVWGGLCFRTSPPVAWTPPGPKKMPFSVEVCLGWSRARTQKKLIPRDVCLPHGTPKGPPGGPKDAGSPSAFKRSLTRLRSHSGASPRGEGVGCECCARRGTPIQVCFVSEFVQRPDTTAPKHICLSQCVPSGHANVIPTERRHTNLYSGSGL